MKEYERFERIGTTPHRSYYIPFADKDVIRTKHGIQDRTSSSRFMSLDGVWQIKKLDHVEDFEINEKLEDRIPVPACVQMHGYDHIQYLNTRYPFPVMLPHLPYENPCWHYRRTFNLKKKSGEKYYINFEGVDSAFYLYINGQFKGYSQISHATSEFDVTELVENGENTIDVLVLGGICKDASYFLKKEKKIMKIALIAHDKKKEEIIDLAKKYKEVLAEYELYATGTTGTLIMGETALPIHRMKSGPLGGDQQIGAMLANGELGLIIFLRDPLTAQPHEPDVSALLRLCDVQKIPLATNASSATIMLESLKNGTFPTK